VPRRRAGRPGADPMSDQPAAARPLPLTPPEALGPTLREKVVVEGREFTITRPGESDKLLDHPAIVAAFKADEFLPYWADLWPAARMLAKALLREPWPPEALVPPTRWPALEVG